MDQVIPTFFAFLFGGVAVLLGLVPWVAVQYRRRGTVGFGPALVAVAAVVYAFALLTYTLLPLPADMAAFCAAGGSGVQVRPGQFLFDIAEHGGWSLRNPAVLQFAFNVFLFVPLGMLVRYFPLGERSWAVGALGAAAAGLLVSAFIEFTQLTGNWYLLPCSYRLFDVDDLIANGSGALLGALLAPLFGIVPGLRQDLPASAPRPVTRARRYLGFLSDLVVLGLTATFLNVVVGLGLLYLGPGLDAPPSGTVLFVTGLLPAAAQLVMVLVSGRTFGEFAVRLTPVGAPTVLQKTARWALGSGGWWVLRSLDTPGSGLAAAVIAVASVAVVWVTKGRRGFAAAVTRLDVRDERAGEAGASVYGDDAPAAQVDEYP